MKMQHEPVDLPELADYVRKSFEQQFGYRATARVAAPGRVNLIGEHIDYNDGFVLPMAIDRYVVIAAATTDASPPVARLHSTMIGSTETLRIGQPLMPGESGWTKYAAGVLAGFQGLDVQLPSFDAVVASSVPLGGGLSSSAALEVAFATLICELTGTKLPKRDLGLLCQTAEHEFAGVPCGIMDQFSSVFGESGRLLLIDCQSEDVQPVPFDATDTSVLVTNSNVKHELSGGEYAERRRQCDAALAAIGKPSWRDVTVADVDKHAESMSSVELRRARHVVSEIGRTVAVADSLRTSDWQTVGRLMNESHVSLRDDFEVSCRELDILVEIAGDIGHAGGVYGARMTGGGFGGSTVTLVKRDKATEIIQAVSDSYRRATGIQADCFASPPSRGAHVI